MMYLLNVPKLQMKVGWIPVFDLLAVIIVLMIISSLAGWLSAYLDDKRNR